HDPSPELFEAVFERRGLLYGALLAVERLAFRTADVVITVNNPCAEIARRRGRMRPDHVFVVATYPDPRRFLRSEPRHELKHGREHLVLWVGRMSKKEGLPLLIDAAETLVSGSGRGDVTFAIVGPGDVRDELAAD